MKVACWLVGALPQTENCTKWLIITVLQGQIALSRIQSTGAGCSWQITKKLSASFVQGRTLLLPSCLLEVRTGLSDSCF